MDSKEINPRIHEMLESLQNRGYDEFEFEWNGDRVPRIVNFPDGTKKEVQYMRDGILTFKDGSMATYERMVDDLSVEKQKIKITFPES